MTGSDPAAKTAISQLVDLMEQCEGLDAEIRFCIQDGYFTVTVWSGWDKPDSQHRAKEIQAQVRALSKQYPLVACYCFDEFSTLLYAL